MESALGLCLGCVIHGVMVRRGWATGAPGVELCAGGVCEPPLATINAPEASG